MKAEDLKAVPLSIRIHRAHYELIERAAALVEGRTVSDYVREIMPAQAAADLDEDLPAMPPITRGHHGSLEAQAAAALGISLQDFRKNASREAAARILSGEAPRADGRRQIQPPPSPRRPSSQSGMRASQQPSPRALRPSKHRS